MCISAFLPTLLNLLDIISKKKEIAEIVKVLISSSVSSPSDKLVGTSLSLSNGKVVNVIGVTFNKEQNINVGKTYITTVKKEVTKVAGTYYDVVAPEVKVEPVLTATPLTVEPVPTVVEPITQPVVEPVVVAPAPVVSEVVMPAASVVEPTVIPTPVAPTPIIVETPVVTPEVVQPVVAPAPVTPEVVMPTPEPAVVEAPVPEALIFNAAKETNLNAALGEVASSTAIPVENIEPVREFGVEAPAAAPAAAPVEAPVFTQPNVAPTPVAPAQPNVVPGGTNKAGFANSKFFMVVAVAFFLASCIFLGYEVFNYFQLVQ